jgi:hypothetical protein
MVMWRVAEDLIQAIFAAKVLLFTQKHRKMRFHIERNLADRAFRVHSYFINAIFKIFSKLIIVCL